MRALNACDVTVDVTIRSVRASGTIRDPILFNHPLSSLMTMPNPHVLKTFCKVIVRRKVNLADTFGLVPYFAPELPFCC